MEKWDLYNEKGEKINKIVNRGDDLQDDEFHLVVNSWIKNDKDEFLITQRAEGRKFALKWECTGGSILCGETSMDGAIREVKEELGIDVECKDGLLIGRTLRYYDKGNDILDVYLFKSNVLIEDVKIQEEEVASAMWASVDVIRKMIDNNEFEANAFVEDVLTMIDEKVYYIGFNANNAIGNSGFFAGSITLYPTKEKGNIYYSKNFVEDVKSVEFMSKYRIYIYNEARRIQNINKNAKFICFNDKIRKLCIGMDDINIVENTDIKVVNILNNKFLTRDMVKDFVPILEYSFSDIEVLDYKRMCETVNSSKIVVQAESGAGGDSTFLVTNKDDLSVIPTGDIKYSISKYYKHLPLNITMIIGSDGIILLPISVQLIHVTDNKFKYVGADFKYVDELSDEILEKINDYSQKIGEIVQKKNYRGVIGIDYILVDDKIYFMEINPRFQSSSFMISLELENECNTNVAELHFKALVGDVLPDIPKIKIEKSFVNCNDIYKYNSLVNYEKYSFGYFKDNKSSFYRKVFDRTILKEIDFES